jgi:DNA-binding NarL/FixJ family response regulator
MTRTAAAAAVAEPELEALARPTDGLEIGSTLTLQGAGEAATNTAPRVFAIDSRPLHRSGLAGLARRALSCHAHGVSDLEQARAAVALVQCPPRILLLGLRPGDDAEALVASGRELGAPIVCVLEGRDPVLARAAIAARADGYLPLHVASSEALALTVAAVEAGERVVPDELRQLAASDGGTHRAVTERCLEVLGSLADGLHDEEIAQRLDISTSSVRKHIASAQERLGARTRTQVVAIVAASGLV